MGIHIGTSTKNQAAIQIGNTSMGKVYVGNKLVWQKGGGAAPTTLKYGNLYNGYVVSEYSNQLIEGMHVPTNDEYRSFEGNYFVTGNYLKSVRTEPDEHPRWDLPNSNVTNSYGLSVLPTGYRTSTGEFIGRGQHTSLWTFVGPGTYGRTRSLRYDSGRFTSGQPFNRNGYAIRLCRDAVGEEIALPTGSVLPTTVQDYDGNEYGLVKISGYLNGTAYHLIFTTQDLLTTKLISGYSIPEYESSSNWSNLNTPGMCFYPEV